MLLGHTCVCAVEIEPYCRKVLFQRQRDGILPKFPVWNDVRTFDGKPWRGLVDVVCGGFPCQEITLAGSGGGIAGPRSGLWNHFRRVVCEVGPRFVFVENSPALTIRGLGTVLGDLASMGYDANWGVLGCNHCGKPGWIRERIWILAFPKSERRKKVFNRRLQPKQDFSGSWNGRSSSSVRHALKRWGWKDWGSVAEMDDGLACRDEQFSAIGNGQVPAVVKLAWETLSQ